MKLSETDRIKNALINVSTLARTSDYYNPDRDLKDIDLIEEIVKKEIPRPPLRFGCCYDPDRSKVHVTCKCSNCKAKYIVYYTNYDYCPHCGQRLDWSEL